MSVAQSVRALVCGTRGRGFKSRSTPNVDVAQQVEHQIEDLGRAGSIPVIHTNYDFVAQLVQSTPLLMEGSWVQVPPGSQNIIYNL